MVNNSDFQLFSKTQKQNVDIKGNLFLVEVLKQAAETQKIQQNYWCSCKMEGKKVMSQVIFNTFEFFD